MVMLKERQLGSTTLRPSALSMGCAWIGSVSDSDREAIDAVTSAFDLGITYFDTDPSYMDGKGEERLGSALQRLPREKILVSTKVGTRPGMAQDFSEKAVRESLRRSRRSLGIEYLDLVLIHDPEEIEPVLVPGAALDVLVAMREAGEIGAVGIGCREHTYHQAAIATGKVDVVLSFRDYTLLDQSAAVDTIPLAQQHRIGIILASVLDMGTLTGEEPETGSRVHAMWNWCRERGYSIRDLAIQFALALPMDGCILVGPATKEQVLEVVRSAEREIPSEVWQAFHAAFGLSPGAPAGTEQSDF